MRSQVEPRQTPFGKEIPQQPGNYHDKLSREQLRQLDDAWTAVGLAEAPDTKYGT